MLPEPSGEGQIVTPCFALECRLDMLAILGGRSDRRLSRARSGSEAGADESGGDAVEPQWELPEDLQEYRGDPGDRKALLAFRQEQHAARQVHPQFHHAQACDKTPYRQWFSIRTCHHAEPCLSYVIRRHFEGQTSQSGPYDRLRL